MIVNPWVLLGEWAKGELQRPGQFLGILGCDSLNGLSQIFDTIGGEHGKIWGGILRALNRNGEAVFGTQSLALPQAHIGWRMKTSQKGQVIIGLFDEAFFAKARSANFKARLGFHLDFFISFLQN